jgi:hypothetical protein
MAAKLIDGPRGRAEEILEADHRFTARETSQGEWCANVADAGDQDCHRYCATTQRLPLGDDTSPSRTLSIAAL